MNARCFFVALVLVCSALADKKTVELSLGDMSAWGKNAGAWKVVEEAKMDESNPKKLVLTAGRAAHGKTHDGHRE
ncbi:MAG: hypothetical protein VCA36_07120 [Opitutales bacterium]